MIHCKSHILRHSTDHQTIRALEADLGFRPTHSPCGTTRKPSWTRFLVIVSVSLLLALTPLSGQEVARHRQPFRILQRLLVPFRSNLFSQSSFSPCGLGWGTCFSFASGEPSPPRFEYDLSPEDGPITLELRTDHDGPLAHHWLELEGPEGGMTVGFGPATLPFIDSGQVSLQDRFGNIKRISGMHPLPWLALPPINYHYARSPGDGRMVGKPILLTADQSEMLTRRLRHMRFVGPYIPIFHDCRTFTCALQASAQGRSTLPCYLLFKGYW